MASRKKRKKWLKTLNNKLKEYQVSITILFSIIGLVAIYFSYISLRQAKRQQKEQELTNIELYLNRSADGIDLISVHFKPLLNEALIKAYEIYLPSDFSTEIPQKGVSDIWKTYSFSEGLLETSRKYLEIDKLELTLVGPESTTNCYPVAIKFYYEYRGKEKSIINFYKFHFTIFQGGKLRIQNIQTLNSTPEKNDKEIIKSLDEINSNECFYFLSERNESSKESFSKFDAPLTKILKLALTFSKRNTIFLSENGVTDSISHILPVIADDSLSNKEYKTNLIYLLNNLDSLHEDIRPPLRKIEEFLLLHPICPTMEYSCISKSEWAKEAIKNEWISLNFELKKQSLIYIRAQIAKYEALKENLKKKLKTKNQKK